MGNKESGGVCSNEQRIRSGEFAYLSGIRRWRDKTGRKGGKDAGGLSWGAWLAGLRSPYPGKGWDGEMMGSKWNRTPERVREWGWWMERAEPFVVYGVIALLAAWLFVMVLAK